MSNFILDEVLTNPGFRAEYMSGKPVEGRYHVLIEGKPGVLTNVLRSNNRERAIEKTNFWDERVNTYLIDVTIIEREEQARIARLTPAEKIAALPREERMDRWYDLIGAVV